jgi:hypothetical protein
MEGGLRGLLASVHCEEVGKRILEDGKRSMDTWDIDGKLAKVPIPIYITTKSYICGNSRV